MNAAFIPERLDVRALARAGARLDGETPIQECERLLAEMARPTDAAPVIHWAAQGEWRERLGGAGQCWLHLSAEMRLPMVCQRCMGAVEVLLEVERSFRFVADEATAEREDEAAEEDLLVLSAQFDLLGLIEDELLMAMPLVPRHEPDCPAPVRLSVQDAGFEEADSTGRPHPFAALAQLKRKP
ncbi:MAG: YceD family protein [Limnohabitans sp.]|jgi:uncharacterized protein